VPPLGRHYSEVWEEEDQALIAQHNSIFQSDPSLGPSLTSFPSLSADPSQSQQPQSVGLSSTNEVVPNGTGTNPPATDVLTDPDLVMEKKSLGPFTERVLSALLALPGSSTSSIAQASKPVTNEESTQPLVSVTGDAPTPNPMANGGPASSGALSAGPSMAPLAAPPISTTPISFMDLEARLRLELKACGLLGAEEVRLLLPCNRRS
jgi:transcriptional adapter 3